MPELKNDRHERFCQEYIIDLNITRATEDSGFSKKTARTIGSKLLTRVDIQKRIQELKEGREENTKELQKRVIEELKILGFSDFRNYGEIIKEDTHPDGRLKLKVFKEMEGDVTRAIKSITENITKDGIQLKFKLHGKEKPLELLARHLGMLVERHEVTGEDGGPVKIEYVLIKAKKQKRGGDRKGDGK